MPSNGTTCHFKLLQAVKSFFRDVMSREKVMKIMYGRYGLKLSNNTEFLLKNA